MPGGARDYYASPDGNVYRRANESWYRREPNGGWSFYASAQARIESHPQSGSQVPQLSPAGGNRQGTSSGPGVPTRAPPGDRLADARSTARAEELASLERQYYARALAQMRAQNSRPGNYARPARPTTRRR
jgi:hypothetical protein